jgi:hypothetical protein
MALTKYRRRTKYYTSMKQSMYLHHVKVCLKFFNLEFFLFAYVWSTHRPHTDCTRGPQAQTPWQTAPVGSKSGLVLRGLRTDKIADLAWSALSNRAAPRSNCKDEGIPYLHNIHCITNSPLLTAKSWRKWRQLGQLSSKAHLLKRLLSNIQDPWQLGALISYYIYSIKDPDRE